jgi:hopene-associated glycosyltransferase HpnB
MSVLAAISLGIWIYLLAGHGKFWQYGPVLEAAVPAAAPAVTVIVPARDEADSIEPCLRSLLAQNYPGDYSVILVNDGSTDRTGQIAASFASPRLRIVEGVARPEGWSGKLWAMDQGAALAETPYLFFTDADIEHRPEHLATLMAKAVADNLDMVSEMVELNCRSFAERALVPAFVYFFALLYPFAKVNDSGDRVAAAAGGTVLIRAEALRRSGGLAAMKGALIDDVTLATRVKAGGRIWLGHSRLAVSIRPYPHAGDVWRMVARTAYVQLRYSPVLLAGTVAGMMLVFLVPPVATLFGHGLARFAGCAAWIGLTASFLPTVRRFRISPLWAALLPLTALFYTAATIGSAVNHVSGRGVVWKRRAYS